MLILALFLFGLMAAVVGYQFLVRAEPGSMIAGISGVILLGGVILAGWTLAAAFGWADSPWKPATTSDISTLSEWLPTYAIAALAFCLLIYLPVKLWSWLGRKAEFNSTAWEIHQFVKWFIFAAVVVAITAYFGL